jgi:hypothetical protein
VQKRQDQHQRFRPAALAAMDLGLLEYSAIPKAVLISARERQALRIACQNDGINNYSGMELSELLAAFEDTNAGLLIRLSSFHCSSSEMHFFVSIPFLLSRA